MAVDDFIWVILAAGNSTRLGQPKQLLQLGSKSLIEHQVQTLLATGLSVCVVSGAVDLNSAITAHANLSLLHNPDWHKGMGTSVKLAQQSHIQKSIGWVLVDQYAITTEQALEFYQYWQQHPKQVLVSQYQLQKFNSWGVPVIIPHKIMAQANAPERGLKPWLIANQHRVPLHYFIWPNAEVDLDTQAQWQTIQHQESWHVSTQH